MKEYQSRHRSGRTVAFFLCAWISVAGLFSCDSDRLNSNQSLGALSLNLSADTSNIKGGAISTKGEFLLEQFENVDNYTVQIFQDADTIKSSLYKDFPGEIEIQEGSYTLRASKGNNLPAAFDNPYFEGSTDFMIKKDMKTPVEVTCRMANARVMVSYTNGFEQAYTEGTVSVRTSLMDEVFTIAKGETRPLYLQVDKEGTPLKIAITLMRSTWKEPKVYEVTNPAITLNPRESVTLKFDTDGKTGDGLSLSIALDEKMEEADLEFGIPDFMYKPFDAMSIWGCGFENNATKEMTVTGGYPSDSCTVKANVPGRIKECWVVRLENGEKVDSVDMATSDGLAMAKSWGITPKTSPIYNVKGFELDFKPAFNQLVAGKDDKTVGFSVYVNDNLNVMHTSEAVTALVNLKAAQEPVVKSFELSVLPKLAMKNDTSIYVMAEADVESLLLGVKKDGTTIGSYDLLTQHELEGVTYNPKTRKLVFKKSYTTALTLKENGDSSVYTYELTVKDKIGNVKTETSKFTVSLPEYTIIVPEGDVWAKRASFKMKDAVPYSVKYQVGINGSWSDVAGSTATGLVPGTKYQVRALINNQWPTVSVDFTTENALQVSNNTFESWGKDWTISLCDGAKIYSWKKVTANDPQDWSTVNAKTFGGDPNVYSTWNLRPSTIRTSGKSGNGALIRSVGWDNNAGNSYKVVGVTTIYHCSAGKLFLGNYSYNHSENEENYDYGITFTARPAKVKFSYKYVPYKEDNSFRVRAVVEHRDGTSSTRIGYSEYIGTNVSNNYVDESFKITYDPNYLNLKATHFFLEFSSSSKYDDVSGGINDNPYLDKVFGHYDSGYKYFEGSNLYIDDVELIYE